MVNWFRWGAVVILVINLLIVVLAVKKKGDAEIEIQANESISKFVISIIKEKHIAQKERDHARNVLQSVIDCSRKVNRAAMVRKWARKMKMKDSDVCLMDRLQKLLSECCELETAIILHDRVAVADAVADMQYVLETIPILLGYDGNAAFNEVHRSNMTKDPVLFAKDGVGKGEKFVEPDLKKLFS